MKSDQAFADTALAYALQPTPNTQPSADSGGEGESNTATGRWRKEEHDLFLLGLSKHGRVWRNVAKVIKTRTCAQVRSHAQKYFGKLEKAKKWLASGGERKNRQDLSKDGRCRPKPPPKKIIRRSPANNNDAILRLICESSVLRTSGVKQLVERRNEILELLRSDSRVVAGPIQCDALAEELDVIESRVVELCRHLNVLKNELSHDDEAAISSVLQHFDRSSADYGSNTALFSSNRFSTSTSEASSPPWTENGDSIFTTDRFSSTVPIRRTTLTGAPIPPPPPPEPPSHHRFLPSSNPTRDAVTMDNDPGDNIGEQEASALRALVSWSSPRRNSARSDTKSEQDGRVATAPVRELNRLKALYDVHHQPVSPPGPSIDEDGVVAPMGGGQGALKRSRVPVLEDETAEIDVEGDSAGDEEFSRVKRSRLSLAPLSSIVVSTNKDNSGNSSDESDLNKINPVVSQSSVAVPTSAAAPVATTASAPTTSAAATTTLRLPSISSLSRGIEEKQRQSMTGGSNAHHGSSSASVGVGRDHHNPVGVGSTLHGGRTGGGQLALQEDDEGLRQQMLLQQAHAVLFAQAQARAQYQSLQAQAAQAEAVSNLLQGLGTAGSGTARESLFLAQLSAAQQQQQQLQQQTQAQAVLSVLLAAQRGAGGQQ